MKKIFTFLIFVWSAVLFAFYELEGPFGSTGYDPVVNKQTHQLYMPIERLNSTSVLTNLREGNLMSRYRYLFLYNRQVGYSINYLTRHMNLSNDDIIKFLQGIVGFANGQKNEWNRDYTYVQFSLFKEKPNLILDNSKELIEGIKRDFGETKSSICLGNTYLKTVFTTTSGIKVVNDNNGPKIVKGDKLIKLEGALKGHFNPSHSNLVDVIAKYKLEDNNEKDLMLNTYEIQNGVKILSEGVFLDQKQVDLLDRSKILVMYGVFKNDKGKESLIWGLAEVADDSQPTGKRKFHWITDIKCDLSELLKL